MSIDDLDNTTAISPIDQDQQRRALRQAVLLVMTGPTTGQTIYLETKDRWLLGRGADTDLVLQEASVSRNHCEVVFSNSKWSARDLKSSNGTWINGDRIDERALQSGDKIQLGSQMIVKFVLQDELEAQFQRELYESATKDNLTGLSSKRYFSDQLDVEFNFHKRTKKTLSIVMCDIDHFKKVNDTYGHQAGDAVLRDVGRLFSNILRKGDLAGRFGGEEILFFLRETPLPGAVAFAERIRKIVENHPFIYEGQKIPVTVSMGVATLNNDNYESVAEMLKAADEFLYRAKQTGRNRVVCMMNKS